MDLSTVESLCRQIYGATSTPSDRLLANRTLLFLQISASYSEQCEYILDHSSEPTALMYAAQSLVLIMRRDWGNLTSDRRIALKDFLVRTLTRANDPRHYLTKKLIQVLCELTRRAWREDSRMHDVIDVCVQWMQQADKADLGLRVLGDLVTEFDQGRTAFFDESTRRTSQAFREQETGLVKAFSVSLEAVWAAFERSNASLLCESLRCLYACLSFDFASTGADESAPGVNCVYLPKAWVASVATELAIGRFFDMYVSSWQAKATMQTEETASLVLQCLVLLAGTRRTIYDAGTRAGFVRAFLVGTEALLRTRMGFDRSEECTHHACRLLSRVKVNTQLNEMVNESIFPAWLKSAKDFTKDAMESWLTLSLRSTGYLLEFWHSMVATSWQMQPSSAGGFSGETKLNSAGENELDSIGQASFEVLDTYFRTRTTMCECASLGENHANVQAQSQSALNVARNAGLIPRNGQGARCDLDEVDPLNSEDALLDEIAFVVQLCRVRYVSAVEVVGQLLFQSRQSLVEASTTGQDSRGIQCRIAFLMYNIGALIGGPASRDFSAGGANGGAARGAAQQQDKLNAELAAMAFGVVYDRSQLAIHRRGGAPLLKVEPALEMATLYFLQCFQTVMLETRTRAQAAKEEMRTRRGRRAGHNWYYASNGQPKSVPPSPSSVFGTSSSPTTNELMGGGGLTSGMAGGSGSMEDSFLLTKPSEMFPRPGRSFEASPLLDDETRSSEEEDEDEFDDAMPPLITHVVGLNQPRRFRPEFDTSGNPVIVDEFEAMESDFNTSELLRATQYIVTITDRLGLGGGLRELLDIAVRHIFGVLQDISNARNGVERDRQNAINLLIERALGVFRKLAQGSTVVHTSAHSVPRIVSSGLFLLESDFIQELLKGPNPERFLLLQQPDQGRARTFFMNTMMGLFFLHIEGYTANATSTGGGVTATSFFNERYHSPITILNQNTAPNPNQLFGGRLALSTNEIMEDGFSDFVKPFTEKTDAILRDSEANLKSYRVPLAQLFRDLRGMVAAMDDSKHYELIFAWLFPNRIQLLIRAARQFWDDSFVAVPMIRFVGELVSNRGLRITFPVASGGGQVLIVETALCLLEYARRNLDFLYARVRKDADEFSSIAGSVMMSTGKDAGSALSLAALQSVVEDMARESNGSGGKSGEGDSSREGCPIRLAPGTTGPGRTLALEPQYMKCVAGIATALTKMAAGRFANMAMFNVFKDDTFRLLREYCLTWGLLSPPDHIQGFFKTESALVLFAHSVAESAPLELIKMPTDRFARLLAVLAQAVVKSSSVVSSPAAFTIETLANYRCRAILYTSYIQGEGSTSASGAVSLRASGFVSSDLGALHRSRPRVFDENDLKEAVAAFARHDADQPHLFEDLLAAILDRVLTTPDADMSNLYALARPLCPLAMSSSGSLRAFVSGFIAAQATNRQRLVSENLEPIVRTLLPGTTKEHVADCLRRHEELTKDLCKYVRRYRDVFPSM